MHTLGSVSKNTAAVFRRLGLSKYETEVVLALVGGDGGPLDYKDIMAETDVPYGRIHSILVGLEEKGIVRNVGGRPKKYVAKPLGEIVEDYIMTPLLQNLSSVRRSPDRQFRDVWVRQITSLVPVIRLDEGVGQGSVEFIEGIDALRRKEFEELEKAEESIRILVPGSGFLDRARNSPVRIRESVRTDIVTSIEPRRFMEHMSAEERTTWNRTVMSCGHLLRTGYYLLPSLSERLLIVDDRFASLGTSVMPVTLHIHSRLLCSSLIGRFESIRSMAKLLDLRGDGSSVKMSSADEAKNEPVPGR